MESMVCFIPYDGFDMVLLSSRVGWSIIIIPLVVVRICCRINRRAPALLLLLVVVVVVDGTGDRGTAGTIVCVDDGCGGCCGRNWVAAMVVCRAE